MVIAVENYYLMRNHRIVALFLGVTCILSPLKSQDLSVKTNVLYDAAALTPTLGMELGISKKVSFDALVAYSPFNYNGDKSWKHLLVQPGLRYWLCEKSNGHFFGVHGHWGAFNEGGVNLPFGLLDNLKDNRYEGHLWGGGISYGYQWPLSKHWGIETEIGLGYAYMKYKVYECATCGKEKADTHKNYLGPTKAILNLIYQF